jgi:hypothetical protein
MVVLDTIELVAGISHKTNRRLDAVQERLLQMLVGLEAKIDCLTDAMHRSPGPGPPPSQTSNPVLGPSPSQSTIAGLVPPPSLSMIPVPLLQSTQSTDAPPATPFVAVTTPTPVSSLQTPTRPPLYTLEHTRSPDFSVTWLVPTLHDLKRVALIY